MTEGLALLILLGIQSFLLLLALTIFINNKYFEIYLQR